MFPATAVPPLPPEVQSQMQPSAAPMFAQMGAMGPAMPDPLQIAEGLMVELEEWARKAAPVFTQINPGLTTLLVPIAQAGKALQSEIDSLKERTAGPSPMVAGSVAPNLPGNIPGARPAM